MARMTRTIISIPADAKKWLESYGKRHGISSAEAVRRALEGFRRIEAGGNLVREDRSAFGSPGSPQVTEVGELRKRAIEAAGRFESGVADLSMSHDRYLAEALDAGDVDDRGKKVRR